MVRSLAFPLILILIFTSASSYAGDPVTTDSKLLAAAMENLLKMKTNTSAEIQKLDRDIEQNSRTIAKAEDIIRQSQAKGNAEAERVGREARDRSLQAKKKNEAARADAGKRLQRIDEALATVTARLARETADTAPSKVNCAALLNEWRNDPARKAAQDCECFDRERPPMCVPKGTKMPEVKEGSYAFYWIVEIRTSEGSMNINDGMHTGKYKTSDEAIRGCEDDARRTVSPPDHVANVVCVPTMWPQLPQVKTPKPPPELKQGKY